MVSRARQDLAPGRKASSVMLRDWSRVSRRRRALSLPRMKLPQRPKSLTKSFRWRESKTKRRSREDGVNEDEGDLGKAGKRQQRLEKALAKCKVS